MGKDGIPAGDEFLELRLQELRDEIVRILPQWQARLGVSCRRIRWGEAKTKWGSCNVQTRVIMLNVALGSMPPQLIEYVLVHELNHLIHPDYSPAFHADMDRWLPDWRERKKQLGSFGPLFLPPLEEEIT